MAYDDVDSPPGHHFNALVEDMKAWQFEKSLRVDDDERQASDREIRKAHDAPWALAPRAADVWRPGTFAGIAAKAKTPGSGRVALETLAKAMPAPRPGPPQFDEARERATLLKAINAGECTAREAAKAESMILRLSIGQRLAKAALPALPLAEKTEHEAARLATKPDLAPSQVDTAANLYRASRLLSGLLADKRIDAATAAKFEALLIRAADDEAAPRPTPGKQERIAATQRAGMLLGDIARAGGLDALGIATYEAQVHQLEVTLGMGAAGAVDDPMAAA